MEIIHLASFDRVGPRVLGEQGIFELELAIALNPDAGDVISGGRGLRKLRRPLSGRGKSGGARVIYYYVADDSTVYLAFAYAKNVQGDLTKAQLRDLAHYVHSQIQPNP